MNTSLIYKITLLVIVPLTFTLGQSLKIKKELKGITLSVSECKGISLEQEKQLRLQRQQNRALIFKNQINNLPNFKSDSSKFIFPLKAVEPFNDYYFHRLSNFVDHNPNYPDSLLDYNGGTRTYDRTTGYNHRGTDFALSPFHWIMMDQEIIQVVAMTGGVIATKIDGYYDRHCDSNSEQANIVEVWHDNGYLGRYVHLKKNSLTDKKVGERVEKGEYLGLVGSSGSSGRPHLHLEIRDSAGAVIDPWEGPYNNTISESLWENQLPYYDSKINKLATHSSRPVFYDCPIPADPFYSNEFVLGDTLFLGIYFTDLVPDQICRTTLINTTTPDTIKLEFIHTGEYYKSARLTYRLYFAAQKRIGAWKVFVDYENRQYETAFTYKENVNSIKSLNKDSFLLYQNYPNPFNPFTKIDYQISKTEFVKIEIFNTLGKHVETLINKTLPAGNYSLTFDGKNLPSGVYYYQIQTENKSITKKMVLIK